jgi:hypothetical protein
VLHVLIKSRSWQLLLLGAACVSGLSAAEDWRDPEFDKIPFAEWLSGAPQTPLKWAEHALPAVLSVHQRLLVRLQIQLDGAEAAKRRGEGQLIFYFQLTDAKGRIYQDHTPYDLEKVEEGLRAQDLVCTESAFVLPGDYSVVVAIYDTATKEHAVKRDKLHIAPLKTEPLADAWRGLAPVEFVESVDPPDRWFAPKVHGNLNLPVTVRRPVRIEVVVNLTPSEVGGRPFGLQDRNFSFLFPALKVVSQINAPNLVLNTSLVDLSRRRVVFRQEDAHELDWEKVKSSLSNATSGSIDVKSLADRRHSAAFFVNEVVRRSGSAGLSPTDVAPARVVIVLSGPMLFDADQELPAIDLKPSPDSRIIYIRFQSVASRQPVPAPQTGKRRRPLGYPGRTSLPGEEEMPIRLQADQLEPMLKPLDPHLYDVITADQFRRALATILSEISSL